MNFIKIMALKKEDVTQLLKRFTLFKFGFGYLIIRSPWYILYARKARLWHDGHYAKTSRGTEVNELMPACNG